MPTHGSPELDEDARKLEALGADPGPIIDAFDAYIAEIVYEHRVGLTIHPHEPDSPLWLSWDETLALHAWLSEMLKGKPTP